MEQQTQEKTRERWAVEETPDYLWIGTPRPNSHKLDNVVVGIHIKDLKPEALEEARRRAKVIANAPERQEENVRLKARVATLEKVLIRHLPKEKKELYKRKQQQIFELLEDLEPAFNLPEHPEKMNGFSNSYEMAEKILAICGINKPKQ